MWLLLVNVDNPRDMASIRNKNWEMGTPTLNFLGLEGGSYVANILESNIPDLIFFQLLHVF